MNRAEFDPEVYEFYRKSLEGDGFAATFSAADVEWLRADEIRRHALHTDPYEVRQKIDVLIPREDADPLPVRLYVPEAVTEAAGPLPVLLYFHGGGFIMGCVADHDPLCGKLADACQMLVISVDYRLAPEFPFPACLEDAVCAATWAQEHVRDYGGDPAKLTAGGDSAGANISAALALLGRDGKAPKLSGLLLFYGTFGCIAPEDSASGQRYGQGDYMLPLGTIRAMDGLYVPEGTDPDDDRLRPGRAKDLRGLPPAISVTAEMDPLRDDGEEFARRLAAAGSPVDCIRMDGMMHGFILYWQRFHRAKELLEQLGSMTGRWFAER
ncbi:MAG: alpha/beta hydrolase [Lachnospiraceae bacterium]|nr:alpha/beta hydrolase [Lachnospiraceae bacterium]